MIMLYVRETIKNINVYMGIERVCVYREIRDIWIYKRYMRMDMGMWI